MINGYQDLPKFTKSSPVSMKIVPIDDIPVFQRAIRFPPKEQNVINAQVSDWIENNIVVESSSDYANNVVLVKKKNGSQRICVYFRMLNRKINKEHYPLSIIEYQIGKLQSGSFSRTLEKWIFSL